MREAKGGKLERHSAWRQTANGPVWIPQSQLLVEVFHIWISPFSHFQFMREAKAGKIGETLSLAGCEWSSLNTPNSVTCGSFPHLDISLFPFSVHEGSKSWKNCRDTQLGRLRMVHFEYPKLSYLWKFSTFGYLPFPIFSS